MPEIRITEEQMGRFDEIRRALADAYVGEYGHVRDRDVVEYLLDTYTPPEGATPGAGTSEDPGDGSPASPPSESAEAARSAGSEAEPVATDGAEAAATAEETGTPPASPMALLDDHDGKWRRTESGEAPYEVDVPDGTTETARTKDDVRRLLFQHY